LGAGIPGFKCLPVFGLTTDPHPIWTLFLWGKMKKIKAKFYLNFDFEVENICLSCKDEGIEYINDIELNLEEEIQGLPEIKLEKDNWYKAKMTKRYEDDGSGAKRFSGFEIKEITCCTLIYSSKL